MDFEKLRKIDPGEWRRVHPQLYGVGDAAVKNDGRLHAGNEFLLTGIEADEAVEAAIETALRKIAEIKSEHHLKGFVARSSIYKARDRLRAKLAQKNDDKLTESLDAKIEKMGELKEFGQDITPDAILLLAEVDVSFQQLWSSVSSKDLDLVWEREVMELPHKEIAASRGWNAGEISRRGNQARDRLKREFLKDPKARKIIEKLGYERYLK